MIRRYLPFKWERENTIAIVGYAALAFLIWLTLGWPWAHDATDKRGGVGTGFTYVKRS